MVGLARYSVQIDENRQRQSVSASLIVYIFGFMSLAFPALSSPSEECHRAVKFAAHEINVPEQVLLAIAKTETGRKRENFIEPWPWAINIRGVGRWYDREEDLLEAALDQIAAGKRSFDVGCFQLNYRWHRDGFASLDEMINPRANALYAAQFLKALFEEFGDWTKAAGAYHSRNETHAKPYREKFLTHLNGPLPVRAFQSVQTASKTKPRLNSYPLLRVHEARPNLGSLVSGSLN